MNPMIFLAEDDDEVCMLFTEALSQILTSYEMHRVKDGLECVYTLKHFSEPNYIFLDLEMPLKDGIDCLKAIRLNPDLSEVPIIIFSSTHHIKDIDLAYKFGATFFLVKPHTIEDLVNALKRIFLLLIAPSSNITGKSNFVLRNTHKEHLSE